MKGCYEALLIHVHTLLYLPLDFRVAYAASISEHLTIRREIDHLTGNYMYVTYSFRMLIKELLVM